MSLYVMLGEFHFNIIYVFQSPKLGSLIYSYANMWAVPCDGVSECEIGADGYAKDESPTRCGQPKEVTFISLVCGFVAVVIGMLILLTCTIKG